MQSIREKGLEKRVNRLKISIELEIKVKVIERGMATNR